ncbi:MAG: hypothetical protein IKT31_11435 [Firmicutes bacterium]|nr:hypothetical protein [Bacillota bacterium]
MLTAKLVGHIWSTRKAESLNGFKLMQAEIIGGGTEEGKSATRPCCFVQALNLLPQQTLRESTCFPGV